jgi:molybdopterin converting factor small subunit
VTVTVRLFAYYAETLGATELSLDLDGEPTVLEAVNAIRRLPGGSVIPPNPLVAVNRRYAQHSAQLSSGDEVAMIPPVAGG